MKNQTMIEKLRDVEGRYPTDDNTLKNMIYKMQLEAYRKQWPLFAYEAEEKVPFPKDLSDLGMEVYMVLAIRALEKSADENRIIEEYANNPIIDRLLRGETCDLERDVEHYKELTGSVCLPGFWERSFPIFESEQSRKFSKDINYLAERITIYLERERNLERRKIG